MKITEHGFAVIEGDTHISRWAQEEGRLDHDQNVLPTILRLIRWRDTVIDVGANIGSHTIAYARAVGPKGCVYAFEPNPDSFECLQFNMKPFPWVRCIRAGLGEAPGKCILHKSENVGASWLQSTSEPSTEACIPIRVFDAGWPLSRLNFAKLDCEAYEPRVLAGMAKTIARNRPILYVEVNSGALARQGSSERELLDLITSMGYRMEPTGSGAQYDVLCFPI
jgi:hypothetical protein